MRFQKQVENYKSTIRQRGNLHLLPSYFKWVGLALALIALAIGMSLKLSGVEFPAGKVVLPAGLAIGLLLVALSRDKVEDEMTVGLRARAFTYAFVFGVLYVAVYPVTTMLFAWLEGASPELAGEPASQVIVLMLLIHLSTFNLLKWVR